MEEIFEVLDDFVTNHNDKQKSDIHVSEHITWMYMNSIERYLRYLNMCCCRGVFGTGTMTRAITRKAAMYLWVVALLGLPRARVLPLPYHVRSALTFIHFTVTGDASCNVFIAGENTNPLCDPYDTCVFPFVYRGVQHWSCTDDNWSSQWCSNAVDDAGIHIDGLYSECCPASCPRCCTEECSGLSFALFPCNTLVCKQIHK